MSAHYPISALSISACSTALLCHGKGSIADTAQGEGSIDTTDTAISPPSRDSSYLSIYLSIADTPGPPHVIPITGIMTPHLARDRVSGEHHTALQRTHVNVTASRGRAMRYHRVSSHVDTCVASPVWRRSVPGHVPDVMPRDPPMQGRIKGGKQ